MISFCVHYPRILSNCSHFQILSQRPGKEVIVAYNARALNQAQRSYSTHGGGGGRGKVALVEGIKRYQSNLKDRKFVLYKGKETLFKCLVVLAQQQCKS